MINDFSKCVTLIKKERMKKVVIGFFVMSLLISCGSAKKTNKKSTEKAKVEKVEKPRAQPVKEGYEEM
jgi:hypothetical protein